MSHPEKSRRSTLSCGWSGALSLHSPPRARHDIADQDGSGYYTGNFGNLLFFPDVLYGSAYITRKYPDQVGLNGERLFDKERWFTELLIRW